MKLLFYWLVLVILLPFSALAQNATSNDSLYSNRKIWTEYIQKNLRYPREALQSQEEAQIILSVKIGPEGTLDSLYLVEEASPLFQSHVLKVFEQASLLWNIDVLENRPLDARYLISFSFEFGGTDGPPANYFNLAKEQLDKGNPDKVLKTLDRLVEKEPYAYRNFELRSEAYRQLGKTEMAQKDFMNAKQIRKKVLENFKVVVFGQTRRIPAGTNSF